MWLILLSCTGLRGLPADDTDSPADTGPDPLPCDLVFYADADGDDHGDPAGETRVACVPPAGFAAAGDDCDDTNPEIHPGSTRQVDGEDSDCDGRRDWLVRFWISVDDAFEWCLDHEDNVMGGGGNWTLGYTWEVWLPSGTHTIGIRGWDTGQVITAGIAHFEISDGTVWVTDGDWRYDPNPGFDAGTRRGWCQSGFDDSAWQQVQVIGPRGTTSPWTGAPTPWPEGSPAQWVWDHFPVNLNTQYLRKEFVLP
jgi:hypothetical protein